MGSNKFNIHGLPGVIHCAYYTIIITFNVENNPVVAYKRGVTECIFYILWAWPVFLCTKMIPFIQVWLCFFISCLLPVLPEPTFCNYSHVNIIHVTISVTQVLFVFLLIHYSSKSRCFSVLAKTEPIPPVLMWKVRTNSPAYLCLRSFVSSRLIACTTCAFLPVSSFLIFEEHRSKAEKIVANIME